MSITYDKLRERILEFRDKRDWKQFHTPKNLAAGLSVEAAELLETFLWKTPEESCRPTKKELQDLKEEIADVFVFLIYLCEELGIDLFEVTDKKINVNEKKYPVDKSKGNATKYTEL